MNRDGMPASQIHRCGTCKAECVWTYTEASKKMPVDVDPHPAGNLALTIVGKRVHSRAVKPTLAFGRADLHRSHFASCVHAAKHRSRPRKRVMP